MTIKRCWVGTRLVFRRKGESRAPGRNPPNHKWKLGKPHVQHPKSGLNSGVWIREVAATVSPRFWCFHIHVPSISMKTCKSIIRISLEALQYFLSKPLCCHYSWNDTSFRLSCNKLNSNWILMHSIAIDSFIAHFRATCRLTSVWLFVCIFLIMSGSLYHNLRSQLHHASLPHLHFKQWYFSSTSINWSCNLFIIY